MLISTSPASGQQEPDKSGRSLRSLSAEGRKPDALGDRGMRFSTKGVKMEEATELEYLRWFYQNADFGPADEDVRQYLRDAFVEDAGKQIPVGYQRED
jgi:hypothetical protein